MLILLDIDAIFDIEEEVDEVDMGVSNSDVDNILDSILDATDGVGHTWESVEDDNLIPEDMPDKDQFKIYSFPIEEYMDWIKSLEKAGLSYVRHDRQNQFGSAKKKNQWSERWYCHRKGKRDMIFENCEKLSNKLHKQNEQELQGSKVYHKLLVIISWNFLNSHQM